VYNLIFNIVDGVSYWHRRNILKLVRRIFMMGLKMVSFHLITQLLKQRVSLARVVAIVGHTDLKPCGQDLAGAMESLGIKLPEEQALAKVVVINSPLKSEGHFW
jgi:hypothetical protein